MTTLHGEPAYSGDRVYDIIDGWGTVESVTLSCLFVNVGKRTKRRYTRDGFTGSRSSYTLEWHRPPRVRLSKNSAAAEQQRKFLESSVKLLSEMSCSCGEIEVVEEESCPCPSGCCCNECNGTC